MKEKARTLRKNQTEAEKLLWHRLRGRRLAGCRFRRQHPIGPFIVDFVCQERSLIAEIDGGHHALQVEEDGNRSEYLELRGFRVVRFWNNQVVSEIDAVTSVIHDLLQT